MLEERGKVRKGYYIHLDYLGRLWARFRFLAVLVFVCIDLIDLRQFATVMKAAFVGSLDGRQTSAILLYFYLLLYFISFPVYCLVLCTA